MIMDKLMKISLLILLVVSVSFVTFVPPMKEATAREQQWNHDTMTADTIRVIEHVFQEIIPTRTSTIPNDFNNPGAIRNGNPFLDSLAGYWAWTKGKSNGKFLYFTSKEKGFLGLRYWIEVRPEWNLQKAIYAYAVPSENRTESYIRKVCKKAECTRYTKLKNIDTRVLMSAIAEIEGYKDYTYPMRKR